MNAFDEIESKLRNYPGVKYRRADASLEVFPDAPGGFAVSLTRENGGYVVSYAEGWHEHFDAAAPALECFAFGLAEDCRLKTVFRGSKPVKWVVETVCDGAWRACSETALLFTPFWLPKSVTHRQNALIKKE